MGLPQCLLAAVQDPVLGVQVPVRRLDVPHQALDVPLELGALLVQPDARQQDALDSTARVKRREQAAGVRAAELVDLDAEAAQ